jgi:hypothetical protein
MAFNGWEYPLHALCVVYGHLRVLLVYASGFGPRRSCKDCVAVHHANASFTFPQSSRWRYVKEICSLFKQEPLKSILKQLQKPKLSSPEQHQRHAPSTIP